MPQCYLIDLLRTKETKSNPTSQLPPVQMPSLKYEQFHSRFAPFDGLIYMLISPSISAAAPSAKSIASWPTTLRTYSPVHHAKPLLLLLLRHTRRIRSSAIDNHYYSSPPPPTHFRCGSVRRKQRVPRQATANILPSLITTPDRTHPPIHPCYTSNPNNSCSTQQVVDDDEEEPLLHAPETQTPETPSTTLARPQTASQTDRQTDRRTNEPTSDHQEDTSSRSEKRRAEGPCHQ
jgi:hypothetical protein